MMDGLKTKFNTLNITKNKKPIIVTRDRCQDCAAHCKSAFKNANGDDIQEINHLRAGVEFKEGTILPLTFEGDAGFYCIRKGHLLLNLINGSHHDAVRICGPGDFVGFDANDPNGVSIEALENGFAGFFSKKNFSPFRAKSLAVANGIIEMLCNIIASSDKSILGLEDHSVKNRVASLLLALNAKFGLPSKQGSIIDVKIARKSMAKMAGTSPESFARTLTELAADKIIFREGRKIHILNEKKLRKAIAI